MGRGPFIDIVVRGLMRTPKEPRTGSAKLSGGTI